VHSAKLFQYWIPELSVYVLLHCRVHNILPTKCHDSLESSLRLQTIRIQGHLYIILPSIPRSRKWSIPWGFPIKSVHAFLTSPKRDKRPAQPLYESSNHPNNHTRIIQVRNIQVLSKNTLQSWKTNNQERLAAFVFCTEIDHCCVLTLPLWAAHSSKTTEITDITYSVVCYIVR
jgi:hypothetical protein